MGGNLVDFDEAFGIDTGVSNHPLIRVSGAGIRRLELYQPASASGEGLLFDDLTFDTAASTVPEPSTVLLLGGGLPLLGAAARRRRATGG